MKNIFIPTGTIELTGSRLNLLRAIDQANGVLDNDDRFHCTFSFPPLDGKVSFLFYRTHRMTMSFTFRCQVDSQDSRHKINYRVFPHLSTIIFQFIALYLLCFGIIASLKGDLAQSLTGCIVGILILLFSIAARTVCIKRFNKHFNRNS